MYPPVGALGIKNVVIKNGRAPDLYFPTCGSIIFQEPLIYFTDSSGTISYIKSNCHSDKGNSTLSPLVR